MARRMGKAADNQYMGGGTGNWKGAPKAPAKKTPVTGAVKKSAPKPMKKRNMETANKVKAGLSKSKAKSGATYGSPKSKVGSGSPPAPRDTTRSLSSRSEVKAPARSLSPKPVKLLGFPTGTGSLKRSARSRQAISRSASSLNARRGAISREAQEYRKTQKPKPQSRGGEMVLGGGRGTSQAEKLRRTRGFGRK